MHADVSKHNQLISFENFFQNDPTHITDTQLHPRKCIISSIKSHSASVHSTVSLSHISRQRGYCTLSGLDMLRWTDSWIISPSMQSKHFFFHMKICLKASVCFFQSQSSCWWKKITNCSVRASSNRYKNMNIII